MINDRVTQGIIAGTVGAVVQNIYIYAARLAGYTQTVYEDYSEMLFFSKLQPGLFPTLFGLIGHLVWDVFLAVVFTYVIKYTSSRFYMLKGVVYGAFIWWAVNAACKLFRIPVFNNLSYREQGTYLLGALFFGYVIAYTLKLLNSRWAGANQR